MSRYFENTRFITTQEIGNVGSTTNAQNDK